jgi:hypothetical protein
MAKMRTRLVASTGILIALVTGCGGVVDRTSPDAGSDVVATPTVDGTAPDSQTAIRDSAASELDSTAGDVNYPADGGAIADGSLSTVNVGRGQIACGATACDVASEVCCVLKDGMAACTPLNGCPGTPYVCSGAESCPSNQQCCGYSGLFWGILQFTACGVCTEENPPVCLRSGECAAGEQCVAAGGAGYGICYSGDAGLGYTCP